MGTEPDPLFADAELARLYDPLDPDRSDLEVYAAIVEEYAARSVLDVGCGTGTLAVLLAARGLDVVGVDPAGASLDVARGKPGAERVRWVHGTVADLPPLAVDLAVMTGNVAQVFLADDEWHATLVGVRRALRPGGHLVLETRDPQARAWQEWTRERSESTTEVAGIGPVTSWVDLTEVTPDRVGFRWTLVLPGGRVRTSDSTLRFRTAAEMIASLDAAGLEVVDLRGAPDRPGRELVFVARRRG